MRVLYSYFSLANFRILSKTYGGQAPRENTNETRAVECDTFR